MDIHLEEDYYDESKVNSHNIQTVVKGHTIIVCLRFSMVQRHV